MGGSDHNRVGQTAVDNILEHHGVKGMKWGVRKGNLGATRLDLPSGRVSTIPFTRRAAKNPTSRSAEKTAVATHKMSLALRRSANDPNGSIQKFNREWRSSGKSVLKSHRNEYDSKLSSLMTEEVNKFTKSGTEARVHIVRVKGDNHPEVHLIVAKSKPALDGYKRGLVESSDVEMVHEQTNAVPDEVLIFVAEVDSDGFVTDMTPKRPSMTHDDFVGKFLAQSGVKGMKWGVRRSRAELARAATKRLGAKVSEVRTNRAAKAASRESGANHPVRKVSDQELQALVNRMRLEQDFKRLTAEMAPKPKADGFIKSLLKENGKRQVQRLAKSALDLAIEQALEKHGAKSNSSFSTDLSKALATSRKKK